MSVYSEGNELPLLENNDIPVPLSKAPQVFFPEGGATVATLRNAIWRGHLKAEIIGRKYFVTEKEIHAWRELCRMEADKRALHRRQMAESKQDRNATASLREALQEKLRLAKFKTNSMA
jgi:hypothetical protein